MQLCRVAVHRWGRHSRRIAVAQRRSRRKLSRSMARLRLLSPTWLAWKLHQQHWRRAKREVDGPRIAAAHSRRRSCVKAWAGWVVMYLQGRQLRRHAEAAASATSTPNGSYGKRKIDEMSTIAEEGPSFVGTEYSNLSDDSSGTVWNTPIPELRGQPIDDDNITPTAGSAFASTTFCSDQTEIGVGRGFAAARTSPRYETRLATAMHLEYTAAGRRELMAAQHWFGRLAPRAWDSWKGTFAQFSCAGHLVLLLLSLLLALNQFLVLNRLTLNRYTRLEDRKSINTKSTISYTT